MRKHVKDFFVPHEGNDYKPSSLEKAAVFGMAMLILISFTLTNLQSFIWMSSEWMVSTILPSVIVDLTNKEREELSLGDLRRNSTLDLAAQMKAQDMVKNEYFAHYSPEGISPWHWFSVADYRFVHAGENLAIHFTDSSEVVDAWMNSPTHRANIVNGNYSEIGVGTARGTYEGFETVYVVQLFGTPAAAAPLPVAAVEPPTPTPEPVEEPEPVLLAEAESVPEEESTTTPAVPVLPIIAGSEEITDTSEDTTVTLSTDREPVLVNEVEQFDTAPTTRASTSSSTQVIHVAIIENEVVLYSDLISTTTGGVPASIDTDTTQSVSTPPILAAATQPHVVLQILYSIIALFVFIALMLSIFIEIRRQHPVQIAYSTALVGVMVLLLYVHIALTSGAQIV